MSNTQALINEIFGDKAAEYLKTYETDELVDNVTKWDLLRDYLKKIHFEKKLDVKGDDSHTTIKWITSRNSYLKVLDLLGFDEHHSRFDPIDIMKVIGGIAIAVTRLDFQCEDCGEKLYACVSGNKIRLIAQETVTEEGKLVYKRVECKSYRNFDVKVSFPTGEVFADDWPEGFGRWLKENESQIYQGTVNTAKGQQSCSRDWEKQNVAHFFVSNSCPQVIYNTKSKLLSLRPDEQDLKGEKLTCICTDLWWVTLVDVSTWRQMMKSINWTDIEIEAALDRARKAKKIIKLPPGEYQFKYSVTPKYQRRINARKIA